MSGGVQSDISFAALRYSVGLNCQEMLSRKQTRLIVGKLDRGLFELLGSKESRKRIEFLLSYIKNCDLVSPWWIPGFLIARL